MDSILRRESMGQENIKLAKTYPGVSIKVIAKSWYIEYKQSSQNIGCFATP